MALYDLTRGTVGSPCAVSTAIACVPGIDVYGAYGAASTGKGFENVGVVTFRAGYDFCRYEIFNITTGQIEQVGQVEPGECKPTGIYLESTSLKCRAYYTNESLIQCETNADCGSNQKCVEGECVDCEEAQATHFRFRWEYPQLTSFPGVDPVGTGFYLQTEPIPIDSLVDGFEITSPAHMSLTSYLRAIPCKSTGTPASYIGTAIFMLNPDSAAEGNFVDYSADQPAEGYLICGPFASYPNFADGTFYDVMRVIGDTDTSLVVYEEDCSGVTPPGEPPLPEGGEPIPPPPPPPDEPLPPEPIPPPDEPLPPAVLEEPYDYPHQPSLPLVPPTPPETGCECDIYLGSVLGQIVTAVYRLMLAQYDISYAFALFIAAVYANFALYMTEFLGLIWRVAVYFGVIYQREQDLNRRKMDELFLSSTGKNIPDLISEFNEGYEPVTIENEYRTASHRVVDHLDEWSNKL